MRRKMRDIHPCLPVLLFLTSTCVWAGEPLSLNDCFKAALRRSETLATQHEVVIQAEETYHRARGAILPSVNGFYSYFHQNAPGHSCHRRGNLLDHSDALRSALFLQHHVSLRGKRETCETPGGCVGRRPSVVNGRSGALRVSSGCVRVCNPIS